MPGIVQSGSYANPRLDLGQAFMEHMWQPADMIGLGVYAPIGVTRKEGTFSKINRESLLRPGRTPKRAAKSPYERDGFEAEDQAYACVERGHEVPVDASDVNFYRNDFDAEMVAARLALWRVLYDQENDIATSVLDGTVTFTVANGRRTDVATAWGLPAATIIGDVQSAKEAVRGRTGLEANTLAIGAGVVPFLLKNSEIRESLKYVELASIDAIKNALRAVLGLDNVLIGKAVTNSAKEGQPFSKSDVWSNIWAAVCRTAPAGSGMDMPSVGRTLFWTSDTPTESALIEDYVEAQTRSRVIRARSFAAELEIDPDFEQLLDIAG